LFCDEKPIIAGEKTGQSIKDVGKLYDYLKPCDIWGQDVFFINDVHPSEQ
jgi:hypothetical protein